MKEIREEEKVEDLVQERQEGLARAKEAGEVDLHEVQNANGRLRCFCSICKQQKTQEKRTKNYPVKMQKSLKVRELDERYR